jgi:hypothetical protein
MPGQRGSETRRLKKAVTVRMGSDLAARCEILASAANLSVAGWLRRLMAEAAGFDQEGTRPSRPRTKVKTKPDEIVKILVAISYRLAEAAEVSKSISSTETIDNDSAHSRLPMLLRSMATDIVSAIERVGRP